MQQAPVTSNEVVAWIKDALGDGRGRFEVQDLSFVNKSVKVVTIRRDSAFAVDSGRWEALHDPAGREALTGSLKAWARRCLPEA
jgi:hypothetical protein